MMSVTFSATVDEELAVMRWLTKSSTVPHEASRAVRRRFWWLLSLMAIAFVTFVWMRAKGDILTRFVTVTVASIILAGVWVVLGLVTKIVFRSSGLVESTMRKSLERGDFGPIGLETTVTLREDGLHCSNERGEWLTRWRFVEAVEKTCDSIVFRLTKMSAVSVPMRAFPDQAEAARFAAEATRLRMMVLGAHPPTLPGRLAGPGRS
ncbi:hypothetical protein PHYC_00129 [Phycisphaerales bacterium]|nr:hypothetical protein PHYC_00129 [Phycisphaerales bacterium]